MTRAVLAQLLSDHADQLNRGDHTDLHRVGEDIGKHRVELLGEEVRSGLENVSDAGGILGGQGGDGAQGEHAVCRHGLDVCLNTGASAGIASGDR